MWITIGAYNGLDKSTSEPSKGVTESKEEAQRKNFWDLVSLVLNVLCGKYLGTLKERGIS